MMDRDHFVVIQPDIKVSEIVGEDVINGAKTKLQVPCWFMLQSASGSFVGYLHQLLKVSVGCLQAIQVLWVAQFL
jgi:hypothetical protein